MLKAPRYLPAIGVLLATACVAFADEPQAPPTLKITNERICPGTISPYQYGQFIEYLCAPDAVDVLGEALRQQFRGGAAVPVCFPQGDRPLRAALVSRRRYEPRRIPARQRSSLQRQSLATHPAEARRSRHARHLAKRHLRQSGRTAAAVAPLASQRRARPGESHDLGRGQSLCDRRTIAARQTVAAVRGDAHPHRYRHPRHADDLLPRAGHALDRPGFADAHRETFAAGAPTWPRR